MNVIVTDYNILLPLIIGIPILGAFLIYLSGIYSRRLRDFLAILVSFLPLALIVRLYPLIQEETIIYRLQGLLDYGLTFSLDRLSFIFALVVSLVWFLTTIYLIEYITGEKHQNRFYFFLFLTLGGALGTVLTADLFSLFIFFELMSLASYVLIVHNEDLVAIKAANKYLLMAVFGALVLLMGIIFVYHYAGTVNLVSVVESFPAGGMKYFIAGLFIIGFGIKAGMFPVHIWLPDAHPVAPTPASALLSGVMIKLGVYGLIRTLNIMFVPREMSSVFWSFTQNLGYVTIWLGIITMVLGALLALFQDNMKKILAYSSISQVGYIIMAVGIAGYMGLSNHIGLTASLHHIINHALFKSTLFLVVGIIYYRTHELSIYKLSGVAHRMPFITLIFLIGMAGIIGFPGFNGYVSKVLLHEAVIEAHYYQGDRILYYAEKVFKFTGILTVAYFSKILIPVFWGKMSENVSKIKKKRGRKMKVSVGILSFFIMILGIFPDLINQHLIVPVLTELKIDFSPGLFQDLFAGQNINSAVWSIGGGLLLYFLLSYSNLFVLKLSKKLSLEYLIYRPFVNLFFYFSELFISLFDKKLTRGYDHSFHLFSYLNKAFVFAFDYDNDHRPDLTGVKNPLARFAHFVQEIFTSRDISLRESFNCHFQDVNWDIKNLDFDLFILVFVLLAVLFIVLSGSFM